MRNLLPSPCMLSTIMPLLAAMGMDLVQWPPYASNLVFELWELPDGQNVVKVLFNLAELHIPGCPPGDTQ